MKILWSLVLVLLPSSGWAVDIATEHTQILNNIELITENLRQLQSLENQIEMIKNQVEGLKSVANYRNYFTDIDELRNNLTALTTQGAALSGQTQNLISRMQQELADPPANETGLDQQEFLDNGTLVIVQNSLNRVAQLRNSYQHVVDSLNGLMAKNDNAVGQTQALQTSNQLAAQSIAQTQSIQELLSEQISLQAAMMNRQMQQEKQEDEEMKKVFNDNDS